MHGAFECLMNRHTLCGGRNGTHIQSVLYARCNYMWHESYAVTTTTIMSTTTNQVKELEELATVTT